MSRSVSTVLFHGQIGTQSQFGHGIVQCTTDHEHLYRIYSIHGQIGTGSQFDHGIVQCITDLEHLYA